MGHEYLHAIFNNAHLIDPNIQHESIHHWEYEQSKLFKMYYKYIPREHIENMINIGLHLLV